MKSITGVEYNNPYVCIKYAGSTFVCVCPTCTEHSHKMMAKFNEALLANLI